jgi:hypothetical protein
MHADLGRAHDQPISTTDFHCTEMMCRARTSPTRRRCERRRKVFDRVCPCHGWPPGRTWMLAVAMQRWSMDQSHRREEEDHFAGYYSTRSIDGSTHSSLTQKEIASGNVIRVGGRFIQAIEKRCRRRRSPFLRTCSNKLNNLVHLITALVKLMYHNIAVPACWACFWGNHAWCSFHCLLMERNGSSEQW